MKVNLLLALILCCNVVIADTVPIPPLTDKKAELIEKGKLRYPLMALEDRLEGWVLVSFAVDETGQVIDPVVYDSSGVKSFEQSALRTATESKYSPAM